VKLRAALAACAALFAFACGAGDHVAIPPVEADGGTETHIASGVNLCPHFDGSLLLPQSLHPNESAYVQVSASDPDAPDSQLVFSWSASSGAFSASDKPVTNYTCAKLGTAQLTVTAKDQQGCTADLNLFVACVSN
jgi:hypothetical protein